MKIIALAAAVLLSQAVGTPAVARAERLPAQLGEQSVKAQALADRSMECLRRGENALSKEAKLAAYRHGLAFARQAVAADDNNADGLFALFANEGRIMLLSGVIPNPVNLLQANGKLERILELDPDHYNALAAQGGLYRQLPWMLGGNLAKAETCLTKAIASNPNAVGARIELAETYRDMGYPGRGLPLLQKAASIAEQQGKYRQLARARMLMEELLAPK